MALIFLVLRKVKLSYTSSDIQCIKKKSEDFKNCFKILKRKEKKKETVAQKDDELLTITGNCEIKYQFLCFNSTVSTVTNIISFVHVIICSSFVPHPWNQLTMLSMQMLFRYKTSTCHKLCLPRIITLYNDFVL